MLRKVIKAKFWTICSVIVVLLLVHVVTAYWFGYTAHRQFDQQFNKIANYPLIKIVDRQYKQSLFTSDVSATIQVNSRYISAALSALSNSTESLQQVMLDESNYSLTYKSHISHGLFAGILHGKLVPTIAYEDMQLIYPKPLNKMLAKFFNNQVPLSIKNVIYLDLSGVFSIVSPYFKYEEALSGVNITWNGMRMSIHYDKNFDKFHNELSIPLFELSAPNIAYVELKDLRYDSQMRTADSGLKVGDTKFSIDKVSISYQDKLNFKFKLGDMIHAITGIDSTQFLSSLDVINPNEFNMSGISYVSYSGEVNNMFDARVHVICESLNTNNQQYSNMVLKAGIHHVDAKALSQLTDYLAQLANNDDREQLVTSLKQYAAPIFKQNPEFDLDIFQVLSPNGLIQLYGKVSISNFQDDSFTDKASFLKTVNLDLQISIPKPTVLHLLIAQMKYLLSAGNAEMDAQSSVALNKVINIILDNQVDIWIKKGYLHRDDQLLKSHLQLESGTLVVNNIPIQ